MSNKYCQALAELRNKSAHELKEVGDQWRTPDNIYWGINAMFGPFVLDLFSDDENAKCEDYYTAEDNALALNKVHTYAKNWCLLMQCGSARLSILR